MSDAVEALKQVVRSMPDASLRQGLDELGRQDPVIWTMLHRKIKGKSFVFDNSKELDPELLRKLRHQVSKEKYDHETVDRQLRHRPFLIEPMRDDHRHKVYMKGRQVGVSELSITEAIWFLATHVGTKCIFTFPRDAQLQTFVKSRVDPSFKETPRMRRLLGSPNHVYMKKIGESFMVLRSAWESNLGEGVDADMIVLDERDRMKNGVEVAFKQSLASSAYGLLREVSTPTFPGKGVHEGWMKSDQRTWHVRCSRCSMEQPIDFPDNFVQVKEYKVGVAELPAHSWDFLCRKEKCRGKLDRLRGRWVAAKPSNQNVRGYHMPQSIAAWISCTGMMQDKLDNRSQQYFYNYALGLPAIGDNILLSEEDYDMACAGHELLSRRTADWVDVCAGIDWGHLNWVVVMARNVHNGRIYVIGIKVFEDNPLRELESVKEIEAYLAPFRPDLILADAGYGKDRNAYLLRRFGEGKFYACSYNSAPKTSRTFEPSWSEPDKARVVVDRTITLKGACRALQSRDVGLPSFEIHEAGLLKQHFQNLAPLKEDDEDGQIVETIGAKGPDHLAHATAYAGLAMEHLAKTQSFGFSFMG